MALGAFREPVLGNKTTIVADRVGNVVGEIWAFCFDSYVHEVAVLRLGEMLVEVGVEGGTAIQIARHSIAMEDEFIKKVACFILDDIEVGIVTIAGDEVSILLVPRSVFDAEVFCHSVTFFDQRKAGGKGASMNVRIRSTFPLYVAIQFRLSHSRFAAPLHLVVQAAITLAPCCLRERFKKLEEV